MAFFNSAVGVLQTLVVALGAGLGIWGAINLRLWAFVTPVGGVSFLAGWALMLVGAIRLKRKGVSHE